MKQKIAALAALTLCLALVVSTGDAMSTAAVEPLVFEQDVVGELRLPEGSPSAAYAVIYAFPQIAVRSAEDRKISEAFSAWLDELLAYHREQAELFEPDAAAGDMRTVELRYEVVANDARYCSVKLLQYSRSGDADAESLSARTFARSGVYAGQSLTLSQLMGLEEDATSAESYAAQLAYTSVWQIIEMERASAQRDYDMDLTLETLKATFHPECDFYMDADGNIVFFVQPGMIAGVVEGTITYPFAPAELLSTARE